MRIFKKAVWTFSVLVIMLNTAFCARWHSLTPAQKIELILTATDWGIRADHDFCDNKCWIGDLDKTEFNKWESLVRDTLNDNPTTLYAAVISLTNKWEATLPADSKLRPYVDEFKVEVLNQ